MNDITGAILKSIKVMIEIGPEKRGFQDRPKGRVRLLLFGNPKIKGVIIQLAPKIKFI